MNSLPEAIDCLAMLMNNASTMGTAEFHDSYDSYCRSFPPQIRTCWSVLSMPGIPHHSVQHTYTFSPHLLPITY